MTIFVDVDTQIDFLFPAGALYVPGAEAIVPAIAKLNQWAASRGIPIVSTVDAHPENDPEFESYHPHCVAGTFGQHKAGATLIDGAITVPSRPVTLNIAGARQIIAEKQTVDCFTNANFEALIAKLGATRCVVYGVATDICVRYAALGLLRRGLQVALAADAMRGIDEGATDVTLRELRDAGVTISSVQAVCS